MRGRRKEAERAAVAAVAATKEAIAAVAGRARSKKANRERQKWTENT